MKVIIDNRPVVEGIKEKSLLSPPPSSRDLQSYGHFFLSRYTTLLHYRIIFHNAALWELPNWLLEKTNRSTTQLDMTRANPKKLKKGITEGTSNLKME